MPAATASPTQELAFPDHTIDENAAEQIDSKAFLPTSTHSLCAVATWALHGGKFLALRPGVGPNVIRFRGRVRECSRGRRRSRPDPHRWRRRRARHEFPVVATPRLVNIWVYAVVIESMV